MSSRAVVAGFSPFVHDSAASLIVGNSLIGFAEEERLVGTKHFGGYPDRVVDWLLREASLGAEQVDVVAYALSPAGVVRGAVNALNPTGVREPTRWRRRLQTYWTVFANNRHALALLRNAFPGAHVVAVGHHDAHAMYAYAASGFEAAAVLTIDSIGEYETATVSAATSSGLRRVAAVRDPHSFGYVWGAVTEHLGFRRGDEEGTVMALAAYGDATRFRALFEQAIMFTRTGFQIDPTLFPARVFDNRFPRLTPAFARATCPRRTGDDEIEQIHADLAAALQERTAAGFVHLAKLSCRLSGLSRLCIAGGVALNCLATASVAATGMFEDVFVPSAPGDSGTAIGAALLVKREEGMTNVPEVARNPYLGPGFDRDEVYRTIERRGLRCEIPSDPVSFLADRLVGGEIVGVFRGRLEAGPRALGNRSILAAPMFKDMTTRLNDAVKFREPFRPFAPSVLAHRVGEWFEASPDSPFMSFAVQVRPDRAARVPAIVHVDGTARVQTVYETLNPFFFALLTKFEGITGIPMLVNTSLNVKGKPICGTPEMALECLCESGLDGLLIEDFYVRPSREATPAGLTDRAHRI